ncbi:MAG: DNA-binding protein [Armatimonadota bacterium]|nr:MAG: DNA-binding protein [Armatimonadota bacterium]
MSAERQKLEWHLPAEFDVVAFRRDLLRWWKDNQRVFPWRQTRDPYRILVAEILLHRTRAEQVVSLYHRFLRRFPDVVRLAVADYQEVEDELRSAGLIWRVRLLYEMAKQIVEKHGGTLPEDSAQLQSLPGISHYIASAVRCFAWGYPEALLDTNTVRIVGRLFGLRITDGSRRSRLFRSVLNRLLDKECPRDFNFALIDLGATVCRSRNPACLSCPVRMYCSSGMSTVSIQEEHGSHARDVCH